jgi:hypothetical protein
VRRALVTTRWLLALVMLATAVACGLAGTVREVGLYGGACLVCALLLVATAHLESGT